MLCFIIVPQLLIQTLAKLIPIWRLQFCLGVGKDAVKVDIGYQQWLGLLSTAFLLQHCSLSGALTVTLAYESLLCVHEGKDVSTVAYICCMVDHLQVVLQHHIIM